MKKYLVIGNPIEHSLSPKLHSYWIKKNNIPHQVEPSNVDEDPVKKSLIKEKATPLIISKNLAELKANKVSLKLFDFLEPN